MCMKYVQTQWQDIQVRIYVYMYYDIYIYPMTYLYPMVGHPSENRGEMLPPSTNGNWMKSPGLGHVKPKKIPGR